MAPFWHNWRMDSPFPAKPTDRATSHSGHTARGPVERVIFRSDDGGWAVVRIRVAGGKPLTVVGSLPPVEPGEELEASGKLELQPKFGMQLRAQEARVVPPASKEGVLRFLASGLIPGIGRSLAERLVAEFGEQVLEVGIDSPQKLNRVSGIGPKRARSIGKALRLHASQQKVLVMLQGGGMGLAQAQRVAKLYGGNAAEVVEADPYRLALDFSGIGFHTSDRLAQSLGVVGEAPSRVAAGVLHILGRAREQGHVFLPLSSALQQASELLQVAEPAITTGMQQLVKQRRLQIDQGRAYLAELWAAEEEAAKLLFRLNAAPLKPFRIQVDKALKWFEAQEQIELAEAQRSAIRQAIENKVVVITGGPGTGKTTLVRGIVDILRQKKRRVALAGPTGRAAKRLQETTGFDASTLHRLLEFDPSTGGFLRGAERPLSHDLILVDEASMIDLPLFRDLLRALPPTAQLVLAGDVDQLPSVGPGKVLHDVIASASVPIIRLTEVYRQARNSRIIANAHRILHGDTDLQTSSAVDGDFYWIERQQPEEIIDTLQHLVTDRLPARFGFDPTRDIQVLSPMRRGTLGIENLNSCLQQILNPDGQRLKSERRELRVGDRVMQIRNNYELGVYNGDIGEIRALDKRTATIEIDGRLLSYKHQELDQIVLAYACSIHKSQGSEYPCVVIPLHTQHYIMLVRNLLYTAVTRASKLVVLLGPKNAVEMAIRTHKPSRRNTSLNERLRRRKPPAQA